MGNVVWGLLEHWIISMQIAEECRRVDEACGLEGEGGELAPVIALRYYS
jgi:hypothetical protein